MAGAATVETALAKLGHMSLRTDAFDLGGLRLSSGEARRLELNVAIDPFELAGERYTVRATEFGAADLAGDGVGVALDVSRTTGEGYALRLRFDAALSGPCMRCLEPARSTATRARQILAGPSSQRSGSNRHSYTARRWPSPSRSNLTRARRSAGHSTRSPPRPQTPARSATAPGCRIASARRVGITR